MCISTLIRCLVCKYFPRFHTLPFALTVKSGSRGATCTLVFLAVLSPRPEHGNNPNTHPQRRGFKNVVYAYDGAFFNLLSKRKEILPFATTQTDLEAKGNQLDTERERLCDLTYVWNLKSSNHRIAEWWPPGTGGRANKGVTVKGCRVSVLQDN